MAYTAATIRAERDRVRKNRTAGVVPPRIDPDDVGRDLLEYLRNKSVVLVGPAAYLTGAGQGEFIDSHDVVVRINLDCPVNPESHARLYPNRPHPVPEDVGTRTDVLYHVLFSRDHIATLGREHTAEDVQAWRDDGVKFLVTRQTAENDRVSRIRPLLGDMPFVLLPSSVRMYLRGQINGNPNTGTIAIAHLLSMPIASLHVTGFDFYTGTGYRVGVGGFDAADAARGRGAMAHWGQSPERRSVVHRQEPQKAYLKRLWQAEPRLSFDAVPAGVLGIPAERPQGIIALVPMKGQSERVPKKNVRNLAGKPLLYWTLKALTEADRVTQVVVDTDSEEIAGLVERYFPDAMILMRPDELRDGVRTTGNDLIRWELSQVDGEHFGQFHVTSPLLTPETIDRVVDAYFTDRDHDSLMTVTEHHFWLFRADGTPVNSDTRKLIRSQDLEPIFEDNNAGHLFSRASFGKTGSRIGERPRMFPMSKLEAIDIDEPDDFVLAEAVMRLRHA